MIKLKLKKLILVRQKQILVLLSCILIVCFWQAPTIKSPKSDEVKGVWITNYGTKMQED